MALNRQLNFIILLLFCLHFLYGCSSYRSDQVDLNSNNNKQIAQTGFVVIPTILIFAIGITLSRIGPLSIVEKRELSPDLLTHASGIYSTQDDAERAAEEEWREMAGEMSDMIATALNVDKKRKRYAIQRFGNVDNIAGSIIESGFISFLWCQKRISELVILPNMKGQKCFTKLLDETPNPTNVYRLYQQGKLEGACVCVVS